MFISVALFISHPQRCKNNFSLSSLWFMSALKFLFSFFSNLKFYTLDIIIITVETYPDNLISLNLLPLSRRKINFWGCISANFYEFNEPCSKFNWIFLGKSVTMMNFVAILAQMLTSNSINRTTIRAFHLLFSIQFLYIPCQLFFTSIFCYCTIAFLLLHHFIRF